MESIILTSADIQDERTLGAALDRILKVKGATPVYVEAMARSADTLVEAGEESADQDLVFASALVEGLRTFYAQLAQQATSAEVFRETRSLLSGLFEELFDLMKGLYLLGQFDDHARRIAVGYGERASCILVAHALRSRGTAAVPVADRELFLEIGELATEIDEMSAKKTIPVIPASLRPGLE